MTLLLRYEHKNHIIMLYVSLYPTSRMQLFDKTYSGLLPHISDYNGGLSQCSGKAWPEIWQFNTHQKETDVHASCRTK